ncbi:MAG: DUF1365 domain-containing protein [Hyphomonas sp.]|uniref:DUF1365 domain-containing protein n=1 Tax=Hyphomonas sp. TaxID=87 RepID=UPI003526F341
MTRPALSLWKGQTVHARYVPFARRFAYDLVLIDLDIDRLEVADRISSMFSVGRSNLFSFAPEDHGPRMRQAPLRPWAEEKLALAGVSLEGGVIRLVTFPRHFFYKFAPLSLWYGYGPDGDLRGIIYEVNNTFGETHCYVAKVSSLRDVHESPKAFHVSPFFDVSGNYRFTLRAPDDLLSVVVENMDGRERLHMANIKARRLSADSMTLIGLALRNPLSTLGVTLGIHWQALRIWLKGAGYRHKPAPPERTESIARNTRRAAAAQAKKEAA